jgi:1,4-dihydroxy-2-naphthoyl-CoA synthase
MAEAAGGSVRISDPAALYDGVAFTRRSSMAITPTRVLRYETRGRTAYITLNRPEVMNALNVEICDAIGEAVREFGNDKNLLVAIISGEGAGRSPPAWI